MDEAEEQERGGEVMEEEMECGEHCMNWEAQNRR